MRAALWVEAVCDRHGLDERRLTRSVFTAQERHVGIKLQRSRAQARQRRDLTKIGVAVDVLPQHLDR